MLKRISAFVLVALVMVGCGSDDKGKDDKNIPFKDSVHAFINSNEDVVAFGHVDFNSIFKKGKFEENSMIQAFAGEELGKLKTEIDLKTPLYYAVEKEEGKDDPKVFIFAKLKDQQKLVDDMKGQKGFVMKETNGITYTEDGDFVLGMRGEVAIVVIQGGDYEAKNVINEAFKFTEGKQLDAKLKADIERAGDITTMVNLEPMADEIAQSSNLSASDLKGAKTYMSINFEKGKMMMDAEWNFSSAITEKLGLKKADTPLLAQKLVSTTSGDILGAVQLSNTTDNTIANASGMSAMVNMYEGMLGLGSMNLELAELDMSEGVMMPGTGRKMGLKLAELFVDFDAVADNMDIAEAAFVLSELDYALYEVDANGARVVIQTKRSDENILVTLMELASGAVMMLMGGGNMSM